MKSIVFFFLTICLFMFSCKSSTINVADTELSESEIEGAKALIQGVFDDVWGGLDSAKILKYHTENFIILENGEVWNNKRIKQYIRQAVKRENPPVRVNKMDYISVEKHGTAIQLAYHNRADFMQGDSLVGQAQWLESATVIATPTGLRLHQMHSTWMPMNNQ